MKLRVVPISWVKASASKPPTTSAITPMIGAFDRGQADHLEGRGAAAAQHSRLVALPVNDQADQHDQKDDQQGNDGEC